MVSLKKRGKEKNKFDFSHFSTFLPSKSSKNNFTSFNLVRFTFFSPVFFKRKPTFFVLSEIDVGKLQLHCKSFFGEI